MIWEGVSVDRSLALYGRQEVIDLLDEDCEQLVVHRSIAAATWRIRMVAGDFCASCC